MKILKIQLYANIGILICNDASVNIKKIDSARISKNGYYLDGTYIVGKIITDLNYGDRYIGIDSIQDNNGYVYIRYMYLNANTNTLNINKVNGTIYDLLYY